MLSPQATVVFVYGQIYQDLPTGGFRRLTGGFWAPVATRKHLLEGPLFSLHTTRMFLVGVFLPILGPFAGVGPSPLLRGIPEPKPFHLRSRFLGCVWMFWGFREVGESLKLGESLKPGEDDFLGVHKGHWTSTRPKHMSTCVNGVGFATPTSTDP